MLKILNNNELLSKRCVPVLEVTPALRTFAAEMMACMHLNKGIGLAANQVGRSICLVVFDVVNYTYNALDSGWLFNPEIIDQSPETTIEQEGCLSFPNEYCMVERPTWIKVKYLNLSNKEVIQTYKGLAAKVLSHEINHLEGVTMFDKEMK